MDNNRFLNQIKSFDHWLFCVHCETNIAALEQMFVPPSCTTCERTVDSNL